MKIYLIIVLLFTLIKSKAQEANNLTVVYNLYENTITYKRGSEVISIPKVKEGENIYVEIQEFNPYVYKAQLETQNDYMQSSSIMSGPERSSTSGFGGIGNLLGGLSMGSDLKNSFFPSSRGAQSKNSIRLKNKFFDLIDQLEEAENAVNTAYEQVNKIKHQSRAQTIAIYDIEKLKTNSYIKPSKIKELISEEIKYAFAKDDKEIISIEDILNDQNRSEKLKTVLKHYEKAVNNYTSMQREWKALAAEIELLSGDDKLVLSEIRSQIVDIENQIADNKAQEDLSQLKSIKNIDEYDMPNLVDIRRTYEEINSDIFSYRFPPMQALGDRVKINISIEKKTDSTGFKPYKKLEQIIPVTGQWKISGGLGIAFGSMSSKTYSYTVVDDEIRGDELDDFIPMVASYVHAYKRSSRQFNLGASFGIGFPLESNNSVRSLSFFLGPTLILGSSEKFLLTAGCMGAKTRRLSAGFKIGDSFEGVDGSLPVNDNYELGYFISISYDFIK